MPYLFRIKFVELANVDKLSGAEKVAAEAWSTSSTERTWVQIGMPLGAELGCAEGADATCAADLDEAAMGPCNENHLLYNKSEKWYCVFFQFCF